MHSTSGLLSSHSGSLKQDTLHLSACWGLGRVWTHLLPSFHFRSKTLPSFNLVGSREGTNTSACFSLWKQRSFIQASPNLNLDCTWIYILCASSHVTPTWLSHWACRGFLYGKSSFFSFCTGCDNTHAFCISIYHAQLFPIELALWLIPWILSLLPLHMSPNIPYGLLVSSNKAPCVSTTSLVCIMLHL